MSFAVSVFVGFEREREREVEVGKRERRDLQVYERESLGASLAKRKCYESFCRFGIFFSLRNFGGTLTLCYVDLIAF